MVQRAEVKGLKELGQRIKELGSDMQRKTSRSASAAAANIVKKAAVQKAPSLTGNLKKNIITKRIPPAETSLTSEHIVTVRQGRLTNRQKERGLKSAFYAKFVEFGTVSTPAQPFLRPALDANKTQAVDAMAAAIKRRLDKLGK